MRRPESPSVVAALLFSGCTCAGRLPGKSAVRPPEQADLYYPADAKELDRQLVALLSAATPFEGPVQAILVPHAAMQWSGKVAGKVFGALKDRKLRRIVVLGSTHNRGWSGAALPGEGGLATPQGTSRVDEPAVQMLAGYPGFARRAAAFDDEFVIETLLPYLQKVWPDVPIVPVILGHTESADWDPIGKTLRNVLDEGSLLVVTATLTHFGDDAGEPVPLRGTLEQIEESLRDFEKPLVDALLARDLAAFDKARSDRPAQSCGYNALEVALRAMGHGERGAVVARSTSLDVVFDPSNISGVSYLGAIFSGRWPAVASLDPADRSVLGRIAEEGVAAAVAGKDAPPLGPLSPRLRQPGGAFVTLTQRGQLRGCMGRLEASSIAQAVAAAAHMAAKSDPRFNPLRDADLGSVELEISVLGPFEVIVSPEEFEPGRHGLLLTRGFNRGLLLPQVASKWNMGRDEFLQALAEKAGLDPDDWRGATLQRFGVDAFEPRPA